jgi:glycosyltransferase involved in cell wall biosynthesis
MQQPVLFYNHTGHVSGAEKMLLLSLAHLPSDAYRSILLCPEEGPLRAEAELLGTEWHKVRALRARFTLNPLLLCRYLFSAAGTIREIRRAVRAVRPSLIHANSPRAGVVASLATVGTAVPVIWHVHDILPRHPLSWALRAIAKMSRRTHLVACSRAAASCIQIPNSRDPGRTTTVLHNGIDVDLYRAVSQSAIELRASLELAADAFVIGIVGQITPRKGHLGLLRAVAKLRPTVPNAVLLVVGSAIFGWDHRYQEALVAEAAALNISATVRFLGQRADVPRIMSALDVLVLNSLVEPYGLVLLEAMAAATPVIATDSGGPAEIIRHRDSGHLVPVGDDDALAEALIELASNESLRRQYSARGTIRVEVAFSRQRYIDNLQALYLKVLQTDTDNPVPRIKAASFAANESE